MEIQKKKLSNPKNTILKEQTPTPKPILKNSQSKPSRFTSKKFKISKIYLKRKEK